VSARDLGATGAMLALLNDALLPNLVQTSEGTPAMVHAGPFGNIAHGTSSVLSHEMGLRLADYVVNETGFAADLGAEKYIDIVMRASGIAPAVAVLVTSVQSLRLQGEGDLERGFANLAKHVEILRRLGLPIVAAINHFPKDTLVELERIAGFCGELGVASARSEAFAKGGLGAVDLAEKVVETIAKNPNVAPRPIYALEEGLTEKIQKVAQEVYGASGVSYSDLAKAKLRQFSEWGCAGLPICVAKTQYSISDNPKLPGAPRDWTLHVTDASLSAGAGFVVVLAGNIMLMPGLPKVSRAAQIDVSAAGEILGV
jgi:formate--tetrahydrofolate ligase